MRESTRKFHGFIGNSKKSEIFYAKKFDELLDEIKNSNILVVVEGKRDRESLQKLGISNVVELSKKPLFQIAEEVSYNNQGCVVLTDLDKKGKELYKKLNSDLQKNGIKIDNKLRSFLFKHTKIRQIEGIGRYFFSF